MKRNIFLINEALNFLTKNNEYETINRINLMNFYELRVFRAKASQLGIRSNILRTAYKKETNNTKKIIENSYDNVISMNERKR